MNYLFSHAIDIFVYTPIFFILVKRVRNFVSEVNQEKTERLTVKWLFLYIDLKKGDVLLAVISYGLLERCHKFFPKKAILIRGFKNGDDAVFVIQCIRAELL